MFIKKWFIFAFVFLAGCSTSQETDLEALLDGNDKVSKVSVGQSFKFLEGPAWQKNGILFFSDVRDNKIWMYDENSDRFTIFRDSSNAANGLMFDKQKRLIICESGAGRIASIDSLGKYEIIAEKYNGVAFNSPNDLVIDSKGGIYFTDPRFGNMENLPQDKMAVYYCDPEGGIHRLVEDMVRPNGIILSPDGSTLYILDSSSPYVRSWKVQQDGLISEEKKFAELKLGENKDHVSGADGLAMDVKGNLFITTRVGIQVFNNMGKFLGIITVPEIPSNCTFGGPDLETLYITARTSLYKIKLVNPGILFPLK